MNNAHPLENSIIATELPSCRSAFGKTFTVDAGKYKTYQGVTQIHRQNPDTREWEEIDARFQNVNEQTDLQTIASLSV